MIIGLSGYKGSGKSTVAEYLEREYGFVRINFKDGLVAELKEKFPLTLQILRDSFTLSSIEDLFRVKPPLMRSLMQEYGTDVRRSEDPDYWVKQWIEEVNKNKGKNIVVDDVRFFNELAAIGDFDGILIQVRRPDVTSGGSHPSETEQEKFIPDFVIEGVPGSHKEIYKQADHIIHIIKSNND